MARTSRDPRAGPFSSRALTQHLDLGWDRPRLVSVAAYSSLGLGPAWSPQWGQGPLISPVNVATCVKVPAPPSRPWALLRAPCFLHPPLGTRASASASAPPPLPRSLGRKAGEDSRSVRSGPRRRALRHAPGGQTGRSEQGPVRDSRTTFQVYVLDSGRFKNYGFSFCWLHL